jgi:capsule biosynthesis phosphatase
VEARMTKKIVIDLDETISQRVSGTDYGSALPRNDVIERMREYGEMGFEICIFTARNMRTFEGNIGKINAHTLPVIIEWLRKHDVPYDEIIVGKPWCGHDGFYIDDRAIRPSEFLKMTAQEIDVLLKDEL